MMRPLPRSPVFDVAGRGSGARAKGRIAHAVARRNGQSAEPSIGAMDARVAGTFSDGRSGAMESRAEGTMVVRRCGRLVGRRMAGPARARVVTALAVSGLLAVALAPSSVLAEATPRGVATDDRIRTAVYDPDQVYVIETDLAHATTIRLGPGERFAAVAVGDTESFQVDPIPELGNVVIVKPHVAGASTNMTVITDARSYNFHLREGRSRAQFFEVRFTYPGGGRRGGGDETAKLPGGTAGGGSATSTTGTINGGYLASGSQDFRPTQVWDDGRHTYFRFGAEARQPAIFKADARGRERSVNWTQMGEDVVRVRGLSRDWTLRIGEEALCVRRGTA